MREVLCYDNQYGYVRAVVDTGDHYEWSHYGFGDGETPKEISLPDFLYENYERFNIDNKIIKGVKDAIAQRDNELLGYFLDLGMRMVTGGYLIKPAIKVPNDPVFNDFVEYYNGVQEFWQLLAD